MQGSFLWLLGVCAVLNFVYSLPIDDNTVSFSTFSHVFSLILYFPFLLFSLPPLPHHMSQPKNISKRIKHSLNEIKRLTQLNNHFRFALLFNINFKLFANDFLFVSAFFYFFCYSFQIYIFIFLLIHSHFILLSCKSSRSL